MDDSILLTQNPGMMLGIIGGSGLDKIDLFENRTEIVITTPFGEPSDAFTVGTIGTVTCAVLARHGRAHNISPTQVNYRANMYGFKKLGCTHIIATTACGSLQESYKPQELCLIDSFIDRTTKREQSFYDGRNGSFKGICHIPMGTPYCEFLRDKIRATVEKLQIPYHKTGTMVGIEGPRFGSKAESRMLRGFGGDLVNMTAVPEVVLAAEAGLCYASVAMITDYDCWRESPEEHAHIELIMANMKLNAKNVIRLLTEMILEMGSGEWVEKSKGVRHKFATQNFLGR